MNELIKKLRTSVPDITGEEARILFNKAHEEQMADSIVYHSMIHSFDKVVEFIDYFIKTHAKIEGSDGQFIYSYQPALIGFFEYGPETFMDVPLDHPQDGTSIKIWYMLYSNCVVTYAELSASIDGPGDTQFLSDLGIRLRKQDFEEIMYVS